MVLSLNCGLQNSCAPPLANICVWSASKDAVGRASGSSVMESRLFLLPWEEDSFSHSPSTEMTEIELAELFRLRKLVSSHSFITL